MILTYMSEYNIKNKITILIQQVINNREHLRVGRNKHMSWKSPVMERAFSRRFRDSFVDKCSAASSPSFILTSRDH